MFKLPVEYNKNMSLSKHIINDLELLKLNENEGFDKESVFGSLFKVNNIMTQNALVKMTSCYSYDKRYLKDTQEIIKKYKSCDKEVDLNEVFAKWNEIKNTKNFKDIYNYCSWNALDFLNNNDMSMQFITIYTLLSPILSLCIPIFGLILPFVIIKLKGSHITWTEYFNILKYVLGNHALGRVLDSSDGDMNKKIYTLLSVGFYFFSVYQNIMVCVRFVQNIKKIHEYLFLMRDYLQLVIDKMDIFGKIIIKYKSYIGFYNDMTSHCSVLKNILMKLETICPLKITFLKIKQLGTIMNLFYQFYNNKEYESSFTYSFECLGFLNNLEILSSRSLTKCKFAKKTSMKKMIYPALIDEKNVKNDISINKNIIITGPNASGKTTVLKTTLINIILSQQYGYGCYESADIKLYKYLHCYLNIPDTSGRDSLFQAEARRCKEIIDCIKSSKGEHFCIFDELYSGTNPEEAVSSANAFMNYLNKRADCLLTTHYIKLCSLIKNMDNFKMETVEEDKKIIYTYKFIPGISEVKGGVKILNDMNFPEEILNNI
jgi:DNA mismatch repair ATPase MutS